MQFGRGGLFIFLGQGSFLEDREGHICLRFLVFDGNRRAIFKLLVSVRGKMFSTRYCKDMSEKCERRFQSNSEE